MEEEEEEKKRQDEITLKRLQFLEWMMKRHEWAVMGPIEVEEAERTEVRVDSRDSKS